jgi:transposase-like protein
VRAAHGCFVQGESIKELAQELGIPWQTLRAQFRQYGLSAGKVETAVVPATVQKKVGTAVTPSSHTNPVAVADGMDRIISLGRLVRDLQAAGVDVTVSGRVVVELEF